MPLLLACPVVAFHYVDHYKLLVLPSLNPACSIVFRTKDLL